MVALSKETLFEEMYISTLQKKHECIHVCRMNIYSNGMSSVSKNGDDYLLSLSIFGTNTKVNGVQGVVLLVCHA